MADRKYVAVSVKHTEHGWKFGMPMVLWGRKRTADNEKRCFSGYTTYLNNAELYAMGDFKKEGYWQDWIKDDAPHSWSHAYTEMQSILDDAPTIVPAEGDVNDGA